MLGAFALGSDLAGEAHRKLVFLGTNGALEQPKPQTTVLTADELNAYFASRTDAGTMPRGVESVKWSSEPGQSAPGRLVANARINFDEVREGRQSNNPLLSLFTGTHDVQVTCRAQGQNSQAEVHIETVSIDGVTVPRPLLQMFMDRYITPKYPQAKLDTTFTMPAKVKSATFGKNQISLTQ